MSDKPNGSRGRHNGGGNVQSATGNTNGSAKKNGNGTTQRYKKVPGRLMRTLKTSTLGGMVSSSYMGGKLLDRFRSDEKRTELASQRHQKNATRVLKTMADLRGPVMKIGQLLSTHREVLPASYTDVLATLQSQAPAMPSAVPW